MSDLDWTAPPKDAPRPKVKPAPWKVIEDPHGDTYDADGRLLGRFIIFQAPEIRANRTPVVEVARCKERSTADLIVSLYEQHRGLQ